MRTLKRPMFNMGGPIKEGIMHGIREPKKHGGPTGTGLVGDQRYPKTGGREHHAIFLPALPWLAGALSAAPTGYRGIKGLSAFGDPMKNYSLNMTGPSGPGYYTDKTNFGETRDAFPSFGIMGILSNLMKKFKKPRDMSEYNKLSLTAPEDQKVYIPKGRDPSMIIDNPFKNQDFNYGITNNPLTQQLQTQNYFTKSDINPAFQNMITPVGINKKQKKMIDDAANMYGRVNPGENLDPTTQQEIFDSVKPFDTKAKDKTFGLFGGKEADPMTEQEYKDYLISQGFI